MTAAIAVGFPSGEYSMATEKAMDSARPSLCIAGTREGRVIEYVDHLHEHFVDPCVMRGAAYMPPTRPGYSIEMKPASIERHLFRG